MSNKSALQEIFGIGYDSQNVDAVRKGTEQSWLGTVFRLLMMKIMEGTDLFGLLHDGRDDTNAFGIGTQADA
jgi:hypothetical protein